MESLFSTMTFLLLVSLSCFTSSEALTSKNENVTIKWDIMTLTPDGYIAMVTAHNYQKQRSIPGWKMSWEWTKEEIIWSILGAQATEKGECPKFKDDFPHSCVRNPTVVDLLPDIPYTQQIANCCKSGILKPGSESVFQLSIGNASTAIENAQMPLNFTFTAPEQQYICGQTKNVKPTIFISPDKRRTLTVMMTWNVTCVFKNAA